MAHPRQATLWSTVAHPSCHGAGDDEEGLEELELPNEASGEVGMSRGEASLSAARFWEGLLRERHEQLVRQDEAAVQEHWQDQPLHENQVSPMLDPAGSLLLLLLSPSLSALLPLMLLPLMPLL